MLSVLLRLAGLQVQRPGAPPGTHTIDLKSTTRRTSHAPSGWLKLVAPANMKTRLSARHTSQAEMSSLKFVQWKKRLSMLVTSDTSHSPTGPYMASAFGLCRKSAVLAPN